MPTTWLGHPGTLGTTLSLGFAATNAAPCSPIIYNCRTKNFVKRHFKRKLDEAGLSELRFHDLRHTGVTLMLSRGVNVKMVSEMLGHADISITLRIYARVLPHMQHSAVQAMEALLGFREDQADQNAPAGGMRGGEEDENGVNDQGKKTGPVVDWPRVVEMGGSRTLLPSGNRR